MRVAGHLYRKCLYLEIDAGNLLAAIPLVVAGALAEFGEADVPALAQFQPRGNQDDIDFHTDPALELNEHAHRAGIVCASAQNPAAAAENCAREGLDHS